MLGLETRPFKFFQMVLNKLPVSGEIDSNKVCYICPMGKSRRLPFSNRPYHAQKLTDLWGPALSRQNLDISFNSLLLTIILLMFVWLYRLLNKLDVLATFVEFKKINRLNLTIKTLLMDGGGEFSSGLFMQFLRDNGIGHQISCTYLPQQNGLVERKH